MDKPSTKSGWSNPSTRSAAEVAEMAAHLEEQALYPDQAQINQALVDVLCPTPGERILEVGCGSGLLCRQVAQAVIPGGLVVGLDISTQMVAIAREITSQSDQGDWIKFDVGRGEALPYPDEGFDAAFAARLLLHAGDPITVVNEIRRVVRKGGRIVLMDWDFDTVAISHPDRELTRRLLHWRADHHGGDNLSGRKLLGYAVKVGLEDVEVTPVVLLTRGEDEGFTHSIWRAAERARDGGGISPGEQKAWVAKLKSQIAAREFLASINYFIVHGTRP
jgi:ubiquinone/menaquinone biosynthesis C-methylase UbiE